MTTQSLDLIDQSATRVAVLTVALVGDGYRGSICLSETPPQLKHLFEEFEENVEGQMFTLADEVEERLKAMLLKVVFPNGDSAFVEDLQVYPSTQRISFKIRAVSVADSGVSTRQNAADQADALPRLAGHTSLPTPSPKDS